MLARGILGSGRTLDVSFGSFPNSSSWWWLISFVFLSRISCHKTTHANGYYGAWPGWAVSISVLPLTFSLNNYIKVNREFKHRINKLLVITHHHLCTVTTCNTHCISAGLGIYISIDQEISKVEGSIIYLLIEVL